LRGTGDPKLRPTAEFVARIALLMSLVALSIDSMLPALGDIAAELGVNNPNDRQLVLTAFFLALGIGQLFYGPVSDTTGRKPAVTFGLALYLCGTLLAILATRFDILLFGRFLQGAGAAGPRIVSLALIRDRHGGRDMARVFSLIMAVFVMAPVLAPAVGQLILQFASWRSIFVALLVLATVALFWFLWRQPETLPPHRRAPLSLHYIAGAVFECLRSRVTMGYSLTSGLVFGAFVVYLVTSQQMYQEIYGLGRLFPLAFAVPALAIGGASVLNARLVMRLGMRRLCRLALRSASVLSLLFVMAVIAAGGLPPLWLLMTYLVACFFFVGISFGNLNALAMEPLGHIAGVGSALISFIATTVSVAIGTVVGRSYSGTLYPLAFSFAGLVLASVLVVEWTERGRKEVSSS
jgi:DHA1 family bicyclomycin/chloramphenicol resistance-like MFS transporter